MQEIIILWNKQNTNGIVNNISGIKSKYFSKKSPTLAFFFFFKDCQDYIMGHLEQKSDFSCGSNVLL